MRCWPQFCQYFIHMFSMPIHQYFPHQKFALYGNYFIFLLELRSPSVSRLPVKVALPSPVKLSPGRCNKHFLGKTGQISPPDTPYKSNTTCNWVIEVPTGYYIQLDFYNIALE